MSVKPGSLFDRLLYDLNWQKALLVLLPFILYANTLGHEFVLDDGIVITENKFVKAGIAGIPELLTKDSFYGFFKKQGKEKLVAGGRYRPMSLIVFALVYELFGPFAFIYHLLSIIAYACLGLVMFTLLRRLFSQRFQQHAIPFAFLASALFIAHPVHTECVANIKGMDETLALLFSMLGFHQFLLYIDEKRKSHLLFAGLFLFAGMLSKENAITYLAIIPLAALLFRNISFSQIIRPLALLAGFALFFLVLRANSLGFNPFNKLSQELMNNPFLKVNNGLVEPMSFLEKAGIISYCLFEYLRLLIWPHPLTHDYYPKQIPMLGIYSFQSIAAMLFYSLATFYSIQKFRKVPEAFFSWAAFVLPLFLVSNILFPVGTNMGERFLFMPSFGFVVGLVFFLQRWNGGNWSRVSFQLCPVLIIFSILTIVRNPVWHDNMTLFKGDLKTSARSAKIHNAVGGVLLEDLPKTKDTAEIRRILVKARPEIEKALEIHPLYFEAHLQLGNLFYYEKNYEKAIERYNFILNKLPEDEDAFKNLQQALRERGRQLGESGNVVKAKEYIAKALGMDPKDAESMILMGVAEGSSGHNEVAIDYFRKAIAINEKNAQAYFNLGVAYKNSGDALKSDSMFLVAKTLDPEIMKRNGMQGQ